MPMPSVMNEQRRRKGLIQVVISGRRETKGQVFLLNTDRELLYG